MYEQSAKSGGYIGGMAVGGIISASEPHSPLDSRICEISNQIEAVHEVVTLLTRRLGLILTGSDNDKLAVESSSTSPMAPSAVGEALERIIIDVYEVNKRLSNLIDRLDI